MTVRLTEYGGTDFTREGVEYEDLNDTLKAGVIHRKLHSSSTARTHTGDTNYTDTAETFTLSAPTNSLIIGLSFECELKISDNAHTASATLELDGTNLGKKYLEAAYHAEALGTDEDTRTTRIGSSQSACFQTKSDSFVKMSAQLSPALKVLDDTTTFTVQIRTSNDTKTVTIDEVRVAVVYVEGFEDD